MPSLANPSCDFTTSQQQQQLPQQSQLNLQCQRSIIYSIYGFPDIYALTSERYIEAETSIELAQARYILLGLLGFYGSVTYGNKNKREWQLKDRTFEQE